MHGVYGMTGYQYDASGARVGKGTITSMSCDVTTNGYQPTNDYVLGLANEQVTEVAIQNGVPSWQHTNVMADGMLVATYDTIGWHFYLNDPLGSRRAQTDSAGQWEQNCLSLPYGDQLSCTMSISAPTEHHFTGKERDTESGLDYFGARYYASSMGRFMSPDPIQMKSNRLLDPQRLNLYNYALNNPLGNVDPDGRDVIAVIYKDFMAHESHSPIPGTGHAGVVNIDSKGNARYFEYGRYESNKGEAHERDLGASSKLALGADGKPTADALKGLFQTLSDGHGHGSSINAAYFNTSDAATAAANNYDMGREAQNSDPNRAPYSIGDGNTCSNFVADTLSAAGVNTWSNPSPIGYWDNMTAGSGVGDPVQNAWGLQLQQPAGVQKPDALYQYDSSNKQLQQNKPQ